MTNKLVCNADTLRALLEVDGLTQEAVAVRMGMSRGGVGKAARRLGVKCQRRGPRSGPGHPDWKGGRVVDADGYALVWVAEHPNRRKHTHYMLEHRLVMERVLGRYLAAEEVVHHKNGNKQDNGPENLEVFANNTDHLRHELTSRCPKWSPEGAERMRQGVIAYHARRRATQGQPP